MKRKEWRKRVRGTKKQIGKSFPIMPSTQKMKANLPTISKTRHGIAISSPERAIELSLRKINTGELIPKETVPIHKMPLSERADYFVDLIKRGHTIPPILVHKLPNGKYEILDGHARVEAYRRLGITEIPAVNNDVLKSLGRAATIAGRAVTKGARITGKVVGYGLRAGEKFGQAAEAGLEQAGRIGRAYRGEISEREKLAHEERLARIRAGREEPKRATEVTVHIGREEEVAKLKQKISKLESRLKKTRDIKKKQTMQERLGRWKEALRRTVGAKKIS